MGRPLRVLLVEDSEDDVTLVLRELGRAGYEPDYEVVETADAMEQALRRREWDIILSDYSLPTFSAPAALGVLQRVEVDVPFVTVSGSVGEMNAVELMRAGARDYVMKDNMARLAPVIERELREAAVRRQRDQLEAQLHQAQRMEAIGRLAGGVAHDFNNILMAISGYAELALAELPADDAARAEIDGIREATARAAALTRQMLALGRRQVMEPRSIVVDDVVRSVEGMVRRLIEADIRLVVRLGAGDAPVRLDPNQLETVLLNLCLNARDAMPDGGELTLETALEEVDDAYGETHVGLENGRYVRIGVSDTGIGMDAATRAHAFEPFFTTKPAGSGSGLGLSTVYGIVTQSGGNVWLYSEPGQGTTVKLFFPAVADAPVAEQAQAAPRGAAPGGTECILVVEDDDAVRAVVSATLGRAGYDVMQATNGSDAISVLAAHAGRVQLVLTDMVMPGVGGPELAQQLRESYPHIPVLLMSGYADEAMRQRGVSIPGAVYLQKPFGASHLLRVVRERLDAVEASRHVHRD